MSLDVGLTWLLSKDRFTAEEKGGTCRSEAKALESEHYSNAAVARKDMAALSLQQSPVGSDMALCLI